LKYMKSDSMKRACILILVFICVVSTMFATVGQFTIVALNDTHSHLYPWLNPENGQYYGGAARWSTILKQIRSEVDSVLFLHAGDMLTGSDSNYLIDNSPNWDRLPSYGYRGLLDIPIFNMLGLDASVIGNHELDYGLPWLMHVLEPAKFTVLSANLAIKVTPPTDEFAKRAIPVPYKIFTKGNARIAVIGLTTDEYIKSAQVKIGDPFKTTKDTISAIGDSADFIVVLSHLGKEKDIELATKVSGIDIIVGGHSHSLISEALKVRDTTIVQARAFGEFVGRLDVGYEGGAILNITYTLIPTSPSVPEDPSIKEFLGRALLLGPVVEQASSSVESQSVLGTMVTAAIDRRFGNDFSAVMSGMYEGALPKGIISPKDFFPVMWPYRLRSYGPEKDLSAKQVMDILQGKVSRLARGMLYLADGLTTLIRTQVPDAVIEGLFTASEKYKGQKEFLQTSISRSDFLARSAQKPQVSYNLVLDLPTWRFLYTEGVLDNTYGYEILPAETFEVLLSDLSAIF